MKKFFSFVLTLLMIAACVGLWGYHQIKQVLQQPITAQPGQLLTLERGTTGKKLADLFERENLLENAAWLPWALKFQPDLNNIKAGTYALNGIKTVEDLLQLLNSGKEAQFSIRFTDGESWKQVKKSLENAPHLKRLFDYQNANLEHEIFTRLIADNVMPDEMEKAMPEQKKLEGWIYPDTYNYVPNSTDQALLKRAVDKMVKTLDNAWAQRDADLPLETPYQMLILASIVEKESRLLAERGKVASVFINRLKNNMKLQTDPTVIYGMGDEYDGNIRKKDLEKATEYNTYVIDGLPPTPIANPSESALMAVAHPEQTDYLYFVADGTGGHKFSRNLSEHNRAVQEYLRWYRQQHKDK